MRKIFYEDINITSFDAKVISCEYSEDKKLYKVVLDATAFFPDEGGQSADIGTLDSQRVLDVQIVDDVIYHYVQQPLEIGSTVTGQVDWDQRFDFMQQHTGEHILSGLVHKKYGFSNVGFHLSNNEVTMDFDGVLDWNQLQDIELAANRIVYQNIPIEIIYPSRDELSSMEYRSKIEIDGQVRIVNILGVDSCACCAPHVASTGQIGIIKIVGLQSYKGGVRLNILCGGRAFKDYSFKFNSVATISQDMSIKQEQIEEGYQRLKNDCQNLKNKLNQLQSMYLSLSLSTLPSPDQESNAILFTDITDNVAIRNTVNELMEKYSGYCAVFAGSVNTEADKTGSNAPVNTSGIDTTYLTSYRFVIGSKTKDCNELAKILRTELGAKCGGNQLMIQGSVDSTKEDIDKAIKLS